jgi:uncharacterized membrane protein YkvA (DUF1232 family)
MTAWEWVLIGIGAVAVMYALFVLALFLAGRGQNARTLAGFVPDCAVLFTRLMRDPRVPRRYKVLVGALAAYLAMPFDLVPDFIPVAGQLDDVIVVVLVLRAVLRGGGEALVREHWPGPSSSRDVVLRLARGPSSGRSTGS